jgi:hypothetical protein
MWITTRGMQKFTQQPQRQTIPSYRATEQNPCLAAGLELSQPDKALGETQPVGNLHSAQS